MRRNTTTIFIALLIAQTGSSLTLQAQDKMAILYTSQGQAQSQAGAVDHDNNYINGATFNTDLVVEADDKIRFNTAGEATQLLLTKYNQNGKLLWATTAGGVNTNEVVQNISYDMFNNIYLSGYFGNTQQPGPQSANFSSNGADADGDGVISTQGHEDAFIAKYDADGNYQWALALGNTGANTAERAYDIVTDDFGYSIVVGAFHGQMNFNPRGAAVVDGLNNNSAGLFVARYDANGILDWHFVIDAQNTNVAKDAYISCDIDDDFSLYLAGNFRGQNVNINPRGEAVPMTSNGAGDIFLGRYNMDSGKMHWGLSIGSSEEDMVAPGALRCDNEGNPYFTGQLSGNTAVNFDATGELELVENSALYLVGYNNNGTLRALADMQSGTGDGGRRVNFDSQNNVYISGYMNANVKFGDLGRAAHSPTTDSFLAKYSNNLQTCHWAINFGGDYAQANNAAAGLVVDREDNPIISGQLFGIGADIDPSAAVYNVSSQAGQDAYVIKYTSDGQLWGARATSVDNSEMGAANLNSGVTVYPNPADKEIQINSGGIAARAVLMDTRGNKVVEHTLESGNLDVSTLASGTYLLKVYDYYDQLVDNELIVVR